MKPAAAPSGNRLPRLARTVLALCAAAALLSSCMQATDPGGGTETSGILLTGRVIGTGSTPVAGVVVSLAHNGVTDTTDALGRYVLIKASAESQAHAVVLDTLRYVKNGQSLARVSVLQWVDTLPDVEVIQRDISGLLLAGSVAIHKVEAVVTGDGIDSADPVVTEFYYNAMTGNYSGFVYFPPASSVRNYAVHINVYGPGNVFVGRSATVPFNSFAGNITLPAFGAGNAIPIAAAGADTSVKINATLALDGSASDAFGGSIVKWEWSIGGSAFVETSSPDTVVGLPASRNANYRCILRVTDDDGNTALDTLTVNVTNDDPVLTGFGDKGVALGATAAVSVTAADPEGIALYLWDFNGDGVNDDSTVTASVLHAFPGTAGVSSVIVTVRDNFDGVSRDTARFFSLSSGTSGWTAQTSGITAHLNSVAWTGSLLVAVGDNGNILTSPDGTVWTPRVSGTTRRLGSVVWNGSQLMALLSQVTSSDSALLVSPDGITWSKKALRDSANRVIAGSLANQSLTWTGGGYIATGSSGTILTSPDGNVWTYSLGNTGPSPIFGATSTGPVHVAIGSSRALFYSLDGRNWARVDTAGLGAPGVNLYQQTLQAAAWTGAQAVAVGWTGTVFTSADGVAWQRRESGTDKDFYGTVWSGDQLVAVGEAGQVSISPDHGVSWIHEAAPTSALLTSVAWTGSKLVAVGRSGAIVTSP